MNVKKITVPLKNQGELVGVWHIPTNPSDKAIILAHGITVDKDETGIFVKLADSLCSRGYHVFRFDFRGHGESSGKSVEFNANWEIDDLQTIVRYVEKEGFSKLGLLGASYGGSSATVYSAKHLSRNIICLCLWNPVLNYDHTFLNPTLPWIKTKKEHMQIEIAEKGWTTLGSRKFVLGKSFFDAMEKLSPYESLNDIKIPTLIIHGTKDTKVPYEDSVKYVENLSKGELKIIEGAEHGFHEVWEYKIAEKVTVDFFKKHL